MFMLYSPNEENKISLRGQWVNMIELPLRILWEHCEAHTSMHANRSHRPHMNIDNIYEHTEAYYTTVVFVLAVSHVHPRCFAQLVFWVSYSKVDLLDWLTA